MIFDIVENARCYLAMNKGFEKGFEFMTRPGLKELPMGRHDIDGDRVYAMVSKDPGRNKEDAQLEVHEKYIDIQLVLAGTDEMGWKPKLSCNRPVCEYDQEKDMQLFSDKPDVWLSTGPGTFAIFFPGDAHMPLISSGELHKVIIKVATEI